MVIFFSYGDVYHCLPEGKCLIVHPLFRGEILMAGVTDPLVRHAATQKTQEELDAEERRWQSLFKEDISLDIDIQ